MKHSVLYVIPTQSTFMKVDKEILASFAETQVFPMHQNGSKVIYLKRCIQLFFKVLFTPGIDLVAIWFADYHSAFGVIASLFSAKRSLVFIGGYDAVRYPRLGMGVYCNPLRGFCAGLALRHTDMIIANHQALLDSDNLYYDPSGHPEGVFRLVPHLQTSASVVWNALSTKHKPRLDRNRLQQIVTVGNTPRFNDFYNKGFDLLCEVARLHPDWKFIFVGIRTAWIDKLDAKHNFRNLTNLKIIPQASQDELFDLFEQSKVYAQPSISEGMPNSLMEAMLCGAIPVGTAVAGIPEVMGDYGCVVSKRDVYCLSEAIGRAMELDHDLAEMSAYISEKFSIQRRKDRLKGIIDILD